MKGTVWRDKANIRTRLTHDTMLALSDRLFKITIINMEKSLMTNKDNTKTRLEILSERYKI